MKKYEITELRTRKDYVILLNILDKYPLRHINYKYDKGEGIFSFTIPNSTAPEMEKRLKERGLVFKLLE